MSAFPPPVADIPWKVRVRPIADIRTQAAARQGRSLTDQVLAAASRTFVQPRFMSDNNRCGHSAISEQSFVGAKDPSQDWDVGLAMANKIPSGKRVLGYSLGTFLIAFPAMILVYRMMS